MSKQHNDECSSHVHDLDDMDIEEWLKDEDEQWANIERYEAKLNNHSQHEFLAPQVTAPHEFLAPQVTAPHVPSTSLLDRFVNDVETYQANELDNIKLSSELHQSSVLVWCNTEEQRCVGSRTSTQVVSHAEKHLTCKNAPKLKRKRESIHHTTLQDTDMMFLHHTDQQNCVPIPNFTMQEPQDIMQFNLPSNRPQHHQMDGSGYVNNDPHYIEQEKGMSHIELAVQQFLGKHQAQSMLPPFKPPDKMSHQMGGYVHSNKGF